MKRYDAARIRAMTLRKQGKSLNEIFKDLSLPKTTVYYWIKDLPRPARIRGRTWTDEQFIEAVQKNISVAGILRDLNLLPSGSSYKAVYKNVQRLKLDTSHWKGQGWLRGQHHGWTKRKPLSEILVKDSTYPRGHLKRGLIKKKIFRHECFSCGLGSWWKRKPLVMVMDHINGIKDDNRLENLRLLCPNCNSQAETFTGRNIKYQQGQ